MVTHCPVFLGLVNDGFQQWLHKIHTLATGHYLCPGGGGLEEIKGGSEFFSGLTRGGGGASRKNFLFDGGWGL